MNRSYLRWSIFGGCLLLLVGALTWITARSLSMEKEQTIASEEARLREQVRLALCRRLARQLRGDLKFHAPEGRGASFILSLPK